MAEYTLYIDGSGSSEAIKDELVSQGVNFFSISAGAGGRVLPALAGPEGIFEGSTNIRTYFIERIWPYSRQSQEKE